MFHSFVRSGVRVVFAVSLAVTSAGASAELVSNGGFETGDFTGWTQFGNTGFTGVGGGSPHSGSFQAFFGPIGSTGGIFQTLATTPGGTYDVDFWLRNLGGIPSSFEFNWDGGAAELSLVNPGAFPYTQHSFSLVASSASTALRFTFRQDPAFFFLDDVSAVPEPGVLALLALGLVGLAVSRYRGGAR